MLLVYFVGDDYGGRRRASRLRSGSFCSSIAAHTSCVDNAVANRVGPCIDSNCCACSLDVPVRGRSMNVEVSTINKRTQFGAGCRRQFRDA